MDNQTIISHGSVLYIKLSYACSDTNYRVSPFPLHPNTGFLRKLGLLLVPQPKARNSMLPSLHLHLPRHFSWSPSPNSMQDELRQAEGDGFESLLSDLLGRKDLEMRMCLLLYLR
jgi:hypothetical protein